MARVFDFLFDDFRDRDGVAHVVYVGESKDGREQVVTRFSDDVDHRGAVGDLRGRGRDSAKDYDRSARSYDFVGDGKDRDGGFLRAARGIARV